MPSIYQLKPAFQNLLRPWVQRLFSLGITANMVTLFAMLISLAVAGFIYFYYQHHAPSLWLLIFPIWMLIRMAFNAVDGMLAREFGQQSHLGAYYNELCDVISDTALYSCLMCFSFIQPQLLLAVAFLANLSEYAGAMAPLIGQARRYDGPMGKSDRAFCFSVVVIIIMIFPYFSANETMLSYIINTIFAIISLLLCSTLYNRIKNSLADAHNLIK